MDSFMDICIQDGKLTAAGEHACSLVYEHVTDKCWHKPAEREGWKYNPHFMSVCECTDCLKCDYFEDGHRFGYSKGTKVWGLTNPNLAFSLDSWMPLWEAMGDELMAELFGMRVSNRHLLDPMWWLEASLRACGLYEKWQKEAE